MYEKKKKQKRKKDRETGNLPTHEEELTENERDPEFLEAPPKAPPMPGVAPSEAPQIDEDTEVEPER